LFSTILFALNIVNIAYLAKGDVKEATIKHSKNISNWIKRIASVILILEILFLAIIGEFEKTDPRSND